MSERNAAEFVDDPRFRWRVDELLGQYIADSQAPRPEEVQRLATELQSRQDELVGQNRELQKVRQELEAYRDRYVDLTAITDITERKRLEQRLLRMNSWKERLLGPNSLRQKLKFITDGMVDVLGTDFARIWVLQESDLCEQGCRCAAVTEGPDVCRDRTHCLHLLASSGRYSRVDGSHCRVPLGCYKIGRVASGIDINFVTNDVAHDPHVHDHQWAESLGLVSFAGYRLASPEGKPLGVLAMFSPRPIDAGEEALLQDLANTASQIIRAGMAEEALQQAHDELEERVQQRTATLVETVQALRTEIGDHRWARQALQDAQDQLRYLLAESPAVIYSAGPRGIMGEPLSVTPSRASWAMSPASLPKSRRSGFSTCIRMTKPTSWPNSPPCLNTIGTSRNIAFGIRTERTGGCGTR